jgi:hypothetical protein
MPKTMPVVMLLTNARNAQQSWFSRSQSNGSCEAARMRDADLDAIDTLCFCRFLSLTVEL